MIRYRIQALRMGGSLCRLKWALVCDVDHFEITKPDIPSHSERHEERERSKQPPLERVRPIAQTTWRLGQLQRSRGEPLARGVRTGQVDVPIHQRPWPLLR